MFWSTCLTLPRGMVFVTPATPPNGPAESTKIGIVGTSVGASMEATRYWGGLNSTL